MKLLVATMVVTAVAGSSFAQGAGPGGGKKGGAAGGPGGPGGPGGQRRMGGLMNRDAEVLAKLNLTDGQKKQVKELKSKTEAKMKEMFAGMGGPAGGAGAGAGKGKGKGAPPAGGPPAGGPGGPGAGMREKMKEVFDGYTNGMKKILTPVQQKDYEKGMKELRDKMKKERANGGGAPGGPGGAGRPGKGGKGGL